MTKDFALSRTLIAPLPEARRIVDTLFLWAERSRARRALREMGPERLADIGVDRKAALREARKPAWMA